MHQTHAFYIVLAIVFTGVGLHLCYQNKNRNGWRREGFALSPASLSTYPLLYKDYPLKTNDGGSDMSSSELGLHYPVFDSGYAQYTNHARHWETPNNGKRFHVPKPISLNSEVRRVNFYGSDPMTCLDVPKPDVANCLYYGRKTNSLTPPYQPTMLAVKSNHTDK